MTAFIDGHKDQFGVEPICKALPIAPSTYHGQAAIARNPALVIPPFLTGFFGRIMRRVSLQV